MVQVYTTDSRDSDFVRRLLQESTRSSSNQLSEARRRPVINCYNYKSDSSDEYGDPELEEELLLLETGKQDTYRNLQSQGLRTALNKAEECKARLKCSLPVTCARCTMSRSLCRTGTPPHSQHRPGFDDFCARLRPL